MSPSPSRGGRPRVLARIRPCMIAALSAISLIGAPLLASGEAFARPPSSAGGPVPGSNRTATPPGLRLDQTPAQKRATALKTARQIDRRKKVGTIRCEDAGSLGYLGSGAGKDNYVVYWSPPPPPPGAVRYVGISRALKQRCQAHPSARSAELETLNLPPLSRQEALTVEEALISHFGPSSETKNGTPPKSHPGQLQNLIHAISTTRPDYCTQLLAGQSLLLVTGHGAFVYEV